MRRWPPGLPVGMVEGYNLSPVDQTIRSEMEVGRARVRRISTQDSDRLSISWKLTDTQMAALRAWVRDDAWSLTGDSDGLNGWLTTGATIGTGVINGPDGQATSRLTEDTGNTPHLARIALAGVPDNTPVAFTATLRASTRSAGRVALLRKDATVAFLDADLETGAVITTANLISSGVTARRSGWWQLSAIADSLVGVTTPTVRVNILGPANAGTYTGDGVSGIDVTDTQARIGNEVFLPTDATGAADGADGGSAWFFLPVALGGDIVNREVRFVGTFTARLLPGLNWQVNATLEVR